MFDPPEIAVEVFGDLGLFTCPDNKIDRGSYPLFPPSAAGGLLGSIYRHVGMHWEIRSIEVHNPIRQTSLYTNEIKDGGKPRDGILRSDRKNTRRKTTYLVQPRFVIRASMCRHLAPASDINKNWAIFNKRMDRGIAFKAPYLGVKRCPANVEWLAHNNLPQDITMDLGRMFFHWTNQQENTALWFDAHLEKGVMHVPRELYEQVDFLSWDQQYLKKPKRPAPSGRRITLTSLGGGAK